MTLEEKEAEFTNRVFEEALDKYDTNMLEDFILYWTEPNAKMTKVRWEGEKFFHIKRRLATWAKRSNNWNKAKNIEVSEAKVVQSEFLKNRYGII